MKTNKKRVVLLLLAVVTACFMAGCGGQSGGKTVDPAEAYALYEEITANMESVTSMKVKADADIKAETDDGNMEMHMIVDMAATGLSETGADMEMEMRTTMELKGDAAESIASALGGATIEMASYYIDGYYYMDMMGLKGKMSMPVEQMIEQMNTQNNASLVEIEKEMMKNVSITEENGKTILDITLDGESMSSYIDQIFASNSMGGMASSEGMTMGDMTLKTVIGDNKMTESQTIIVDMSMDTDGQVTKMSCVMTSTYSDLNGDFTIEFPDFSEYQEVSM